MAKSRVDVQKLAGDLQHSKLVDFNLPAKSFIDVAHTHFGPGGDAAADWNAIVGSHYVLITGAEAEAAKQKVNPVLPATPLTKPQG